MNSNPEAQGSQLTKAPDVEAFLRLLFDDLEGHIEVRLIEDKKRGKQVAREWYGGASALVADISELLKIAERGSAAVFFGVLPRPDGKGKAVDALPGRVVWADLDFKDFEGGESEARARLGELPITPTILVRSGHGLHAYWVLSEQAEPEILSGMAKRVAAAIGGDHTFDAARLLRLPGTLNRKDPNDPIPVEIEALDENHLVNAGDLDDALDLLSGPDGVLSVQAAESPDDRASKAPDQPATRTDGLSRRVAALIDSKPKIRAYFEGRGKQPHGPDGRPLDETSSGYDFSFLLSLIREGVGDPAELATALACRPDGVAREKHASYIPRTVERAQAFATDLIQQARCESVDFVVDEVRTYNSDDPEFELLIEGKTVRLTAASFLSIPKFRTAFVSVHHRVPLLPKKREDWTPLVNRWLAGAVTVDLGNDASDELALAEDIQARISDLHVGESEEDLELGQSVVLPSGKVLFKVQPQLEWIMNRHPKAGRPQICRILRELGYQSGTFSIGGVKVRGWA